MKNIYDECVKVQNASNFSGVAIAFGNAIKVLHEEKDWLNSHGVIVDLRTHPVVIWWICKLHSMVTKDDPHIGTTMEHLYTLSYPTLTYLSITEMKSPEHLERFKLYHEAVAKYEAGDESVAYSPPNA